MDNKTLFWSFYDNFCAFCASLWLIKHLFRCLKIKVCPKGLHSFTFSFQSLIPRPSSLTPNPSPLAPNVIVRKYLRVDKALYNCRETFTDVMDSLQIKLFLQNEPNFRKSQVNVNKVITKDYEKKDTWLSGKNEPNTNPIRTQYEPN